MSSSDCDEEKREGSRRVRVRKIEKEERSRWIKDRDGSSTSDDEGGIAARAYGERVHRNRERAISENAERKR